MAEEDGEERGRLVKSDSTESRWVYEYDGDVEIDDDDDEEDEEEESPSRMHVNSEDEGNVEQPLMRTGPRVDSFDVEALEVPGAQKYDLEVGVFLLC